MRGKRHDRPQAVTADNHPLSLNLSWQEDHDEKKLLVKEKGKEYGIYLQSTQCKSRLTVPQCTCFTKNSFPLSLPTSAITDWFVCHPTKQSHLDRFLPPSCEMWSTVSDHCFLQKMRRQKQIPFLPSFPPTSLAPQIQKIKLRKAAVKETGNRTESKTLLSSRTAGRGGGDISTCCEAIKDIAW